MSKLPNKLKTPLNKNRMGTATANVRAKVFDLTRAHFGNNSQRGSSYSKSKDDMAFTSNNPIKKAPKRRESIVTMSSQAKKGKTDEGAMINQYVILKTLGKGSFATVLLCKDVKTSE